MQLLGTLSEAQDKVCLDIKRLVAQVRHLSSSTVDSVVQGIAILKRLREETYEDLNQIQHEHMILLAANWLVANQRSDAATQWYWNPRQTGDRTEPDLRGKLNDTTVISAEITTSKNPVGTIDSRMASTLRKLNLMDGQKFYFVRTDSMANRARTKIEKAKWNIEVIALRCIDDDFSGGDAAISIQKLKTAPIPHQGSATTRKRSIVDVLAEAPGHLMFQTADEVDAYIREERDAWES